MNKEQLLAELDSTHSELNAVLRAIDDQRMIESMNGKWSIIKHVIHLSKALSALHKGLKRPKFLIRYSFGRPNRPGRTYEEVKDRYYTKLSRVPAGVSSPFVPKEGDEFTKQVVQEKFILNQKALSKSLERWNDGQLDKYLLPHPLLGKVTVREMLMFMYFHTRHHMEIIKRMCSPE